MADIEAMLTALGALHPKRIDLSLGRIERLLDALGRPQDDLPPVIHVAGTNGKGSTIAFLRAMLEAQGASVHAYTSPHLVRFNERIRLAGQLVSDDQLAAAIADVEAANNREPITYFEITTAIALKLFAETAADYTILEVGLGGRFDATNVIASPLACVITPVSLDHAEFLGTDLAGIAAEKAGILKKDRPAIIGPQDLHALAMIELEAGAIEAGPRYRHGTEWTSFPESGRLVFQDENGLLDLPLPRMQGDYQLDNAATAIATLRCLGLARPDAVEAGLTSATWPARLQRLRQGPLVARAPEQAEIWLDGGHNVAAGHALATNLAALEERSSRPLILICGMLSNKDAAGFLEPFEGLARHLIAVPVESSAAGFSPGELADISMQVQIPAKTADSVGQALDELNAANEPLRVLICGSLYLAGDVLRENGPLPD